MPSHVKGAPVQERLPEAASLLLDVMRFGLALLVVAGHMTLPWFSWGWGPLLNLADAAVPGFFVLSGFMIRYVTLDRERDPRRYFISRASRMYSVLLPAIALTLLTRVVIRAMAPGYAMTMFDDPPVVATLGHVIAHVLFLTQGWGHAVLLAPNLPLWSLGYEVPYYVLFGWLMLCRGAWRWFAVAVYAVVVGPQVLFLLPLWWSGCLLYDAWQWARCSGARRIWCGVLAVVTLVLLIVPMGGVTGASRITGAPNPLMWVHQPPTRATMLAYSCGVVSWFAMLLGLLLSDFVKLSKGAPWARVVRFVAEGTFTLYLFHYPLLCFIFPLHGDALHHSGPTWLVFVVVTALCVVAAVPIEWLKKWMRLRLSAVFLAR